MPLKHHCHWAHECPLWAHGAPEPLLHLMPDGVCSHLQGNVNNNILKWPVVVLEEGKRGPNWIYPTGSSLCTIYHCKTVVVKKAIVHKKVLYSFKWLERGHLSCQWFKTFYFCTYSYKRGCLFIYLALYSMKWTELLLDISVATLSCCSIRRRPPWFGSPLEFPLCFWLRLWCFSSNPNIQGRSWRMNIKQGAQRVTVRASVFCFSETVIEKVILASVFILRADDLHGH